MTLTCDANNSRANATLFSGPYKILLNDIELNYQFNACNGLPTWSIYGGKINFRDISITL